MRLWESHAPDGAEQIVWKTKRFRLEFIIYPNLAWKTLVTPNRLEKQMILSSETSVFVQNVRFTLLVALESHNRLENKVISLQFRYRHLVTESSGKTSDCWNYLRNRPGQAFRELEIVWNTKRYCKVSINSPAPQAMETRNPCEK